MDIREFDSKRLNLYRLWHEYLAETLVHTANDVKALAEIGDIDALETRCNELLGLCKSLKSNGDAMCQLQVRHEAMKGR